MNALRRPLTLLSLVLSGVGLGLSTYLTYVHYNPGALVCSDGGCAIVQLSEYSTMFGVPIALFGVGMFVTLIAGIALRELRDDFSDLVSTGMITILVAAVLYWAYLTYLEAYVIHAFCQWCVITSIVTTLLLVVEGIRWYQGYRTPGFE